MTTASLHQARLAIIAEPHKLLLGASVTGVTLFWGIALWIAYF